MMILCGNYNTIWHYFAGRYPGQIGVLMGPAYFKRIPIKWWMPYALDNDAYSAYSNNIEWDVNAWRQMLKLAKNTGQDPIWVLVPDVVADKKATLEKWNQYQPEASKFKWKLAFAVQDGMTPDDVPSNADVVFVGGTTLWKWKTIPMWTKHFKRVHVGRVNEFRRLCTCEDFGVESVDGSGWFRDTDKGRRAKALLRFLDGDRNGTPELFDTKQL